MNQANRTKAELEVDLQPIKEMLDSCRDRVVSHLEQLETKAALVGSRAQLRLTKTAGETRELIHRHPLTLVLASLGVGLLLGGLTTIALSQRMAAGGSVAPAP